VAVQDAERTLDVGDRLGAICIKSIRVPFNRDRLNETARLARRVSMRFAAARWDR
jgi:hypothetical protein